MGRCSGLASAWDRSSRLDQGRPGSAAVGRALLACRAAPVHHRTAHAAAWRSAFRHAAGCVTLLQIRGLMGGSMQRFGKALCALATGLAVAISLASASQAQEWPQRTV